MMALVAVEAYCSAAVFPYPTSPASRLDFYFE